MTTSVYVLQLESGKYYVGKSAYPQSRILDHFDSDGSAWTKRYKPVKVLSCQLGNGFDEEKITLETMAKYGIDNVRGGSYCKLELSTVDKTEIARIINAATDKCYKCGQSGHYSADCTVGLVRPRRTIKTMVVIRCHRCGRAGHYAPDCYAKTTATGNKIAAGCHCYRCGRPGHYSPDCYAKTTATGESLDSSDSDSDKSGGSNWCFVD